MNSKGISIINLLFLTIFILLFTSCSRAEDDTKIVCSYGQKKDCSCDDGSEGKQLCKDNEWQVCTCNTAEICKDVTCSNNGYCTVKNEEPYCNCNEGYHDDGINCIKDGEVNPCETNNCGENSHCIVESDEAVCICNSDYILDVDKCVFDCSDLSNSHPNESNNACECDVNYHLDSNKCVEDEGFKCDNYECSDVNSHCIVENDEAKCVCNAGFKEDANICVLDCSLIENSHPNDLQDECICNNGLHLEENLCVSNQKTVNCNDVSVPQNGHQINEDILISWTEENGWEIPVNCSWACNDYYQDFDNNHTCEPACENNSCENGTCDDGSGLINCICNEGYQDNNNDETCLPDCSSTVINGSECGGNGVCHDNTGEVICICDNGYQDNDNNGTCKEKCHTDLLSPELSTCGKFGTCRDLSGEIVCTCNDGYFIDPNTSKCVAPCEGIDCGLHGECVAMGLTNMSCNCDLGYQDNNNNLICTKSCQSSCLENSTSCDDSNGQLTCQCDIGYQDNDRDGTCLNSCLSIVCDGVKQVLNSCNDLSGFPVCNYVQGYNYTSLISGTNSQIVNDSMVDSNGNLYIVGSFKGTVDFDHTSGIDSRDSFGEDDVFITRINADNSYGWTYSVGSNSSDGGVSIAIDNYDNIYITGYFSSTVDFDPSSEIHLLRSDYGYKDIFILKITNHGDYSWSNSIMSDDNGIPTSIKLDDDSIYLTGSFVGSGNPDVTIGVNFDRTSNNGNFVVKGREDGFVSRFNISNGSYVWARLFGAEGRYNSALDVISYGNDVIVTGGVNGDVYFDETNILEGLISTGFKFETFILKLSKDNQFIWVKELKSQDNADVSRGVRLSANNNIIYLSGFLSGNIDFDTSDNQDIVNAGAYQGIYIAKVDENGLITDKEIFTSTNNSSIINDFLIHDSNLYLVGNIQGTLNIQGTNITNTSTDTNNNDVFAVKLDSDLTVSNIFNFGGSLDDQGKTISVGNNNEIYIIGIFNGTTDFDQSTAIDSKTTQELEDIFITRYNE